MNPLVTGTVLVATELSDFCAQVMILSPPTLKNCDRCSQYFFIRHVLSCSCRGLVITCQNKVCDKILYLAQNDFPSNWLCSKPLIHQGKRIPEKEVRQGTRGLEKQGDVLIRGLWKIQTDDIINVIFGDSDADT